MEPNLCVLMDFENIAAGTEREGHGRFDTSLVMSRLKEKGRILIARSYGDWGRFAKYKQAMLENGIQAVELTSYRSQEKNRADIALAVDAMELAFSRSYIDTFVLLSGDSDFTPLVMRLRELNRRVIGIGTRRSSSRLLVESCDEFIFYESIARSRRAVEPEPEQRARPRPEPEPSTDAVVSIDKDEAFRLVVETIEGIQKDEAGPVQGGRLKQSILRKVPTFDESEYGYAGFARFLEAARDRGLVRLSQDESAGGYRVDLPGDAPPPVEVEAPPEELVTLPGEAGRLAQVLVRQGIDPLTALLRHAIMHELVDHVTDRTRKKKRNTLLYTVGDVARRCRQADPPARPSQVRSLLQALFQAGELRHTDGNPIRKDTAPFVLRGDVEDLLRALRAFYVDQLLAAGEPLRDGRALSMLLWGDEDHVTPSEELVAWTSHARREAAASPRAAEPETAASPSAPREALAPVDEPKAETASAPEEASALPTEDGGDAGSGRRRRRRGGKRAAEGPAEGGEDAATGATPAEAGSGPEGTAAAPSPAESGPETEAGAEPPRRSTRGRRTRRPRTEGGASEQGGGDGQGE